MAWTKFQIVLAVVMVFTGSINTLATKWADMTKSWNTATPSEKVAFNHPFVEASCMFVGEMLCLIAYYAFMYRSKRKNVPTIETPVGPKWNRFILYPAAFSDMTSTCLMYVGLVLTYPSSYQILRGACIIFTAILSKLLLKRTLPNSAWFGICVVSAGLVVVGISDFVYADDGSDDSGYDNGTDFSTEFGVSTTESPGSDSSYTLKGIVTGDILIVLAQVVSAYQVVYEEKYLTKYDIDALQVVGLEGVFGFVTLSLLLIPFYYIPVPESFSGNPRNVLEDAIDAFVQMGNNGIIILALSISIFSIAFFNFSGISVTKELSATTRMVFDNARTLFVWIVSLALYWEVFHWPQVIGFLLLVIGTFIYNGAIKVPCCDEVEGVGNSRPVSQTVSQTACELKESCYDNDGLQESRSTSDRF